MARIDELEARIAELEAWRAEGMKADWIPRSELDGWQGEHDRVHQELDAILFDIPPASPEDDPATPWDESRGPNPFDQAA